MLVPVVLLTGFLGSGKTTLLNRLLAHRRENSVSPPDPPGGPADRRSAQTAPQTPPDGKIAVLVNELGSVGIDGSLLPPGNARQVELAGGCICCTLDENLAQSLTSLLDAEPEVKWVLIETTGIAEPLPIIWTLTGESLSQRIRLAAVVTVVDALEHQRHRPLAMSVDAQVEHADILVVSKRDALQSGAAPGERAALPDLLAQLRHRNPTATLLVESSPAASASALWQLLSDEHADSALERSGLAHNQHIMTSTSAASGDAHGSPDHAHGPAAHGFDAVAVPIEGTLDFEELTSQLEQLPAEYIRIKGICWAVDRENGSADPTLIAFHRVGARVSAEPISEPSLREAVPRAVALGVGIDPDRLAACLRAAMVV